MNYKLLNLQRFQISPHWTGCKFFTIQRTTKLPKNWFSRYLYNNHIKQIPKGAFQNLPRLKILRLDHNALICDCKIAWLSRMLSKTHTKLQASAICDQPREMSGMSIINMEPSHFHCGILSRTST